MRLYPITFLPMKNSYCRNFLQQLVKFTYTEKTILQWKKKGVFLTKLFLSDFSESLLRWFGHACDTQQETKFLTIMCHRRRTEEIKEDSNIIHILCKNESKEFLKYNFQITLENGTIIPPTPITGNEKKQKEPTTI